MRVMGKENGRGQREGENTCLCLGVFTVIEAISFTNTISRLNTMLLVDINSNGLTDFVASIRLRPAVMAWWGGADRRLDYSHRGSVPK